MIDATLFAQVLDYSNRSNPYPLYARLREAPVARQENGIYTVSGFDEIRSLLFDSRLSSKVMPKLKYAKTGNPVTDWVINPIKEHMMEKHRSLVFRDPPDHDILRRLVMLQFNPERTRRMQERIGAIVDDLIAGMRGRRELDSVAEFSYPLPVTVICEILGVPAADEQKFHRWATTFADSLDPDQIQIQANLHKTTADYDAIFDYLRALIKTKRKDPQDDVLSGLATFRDEKAGRMGRLDLIATSVLLLVAGHETTVNLISNGMLTLLRQPNYLEALRSQPGLAARMTEELLRFDPPVQFIRRKAMEDIDMSGVCIPKDSLIILLLAACARDPKRFQDPDRFDPGRNNIQHLGFGAGVHYCIGAPLARAEAEIALPALAKRLINPSLVADPPPYRPAAFLRGPERLVIRLEGIR
jgi:cytochrome P450